MKRLLLILLSLSLLACVPIPCEESALTVPSVTAIPIETDDVRIVQETSPQVIGALPTNAAPVETTPTENKYTTYESARLSEPLPHAVTLREIDWTKYSNGKPFEMALRLETLDFRNMRFLIEDFRSDDTGTQFTIRINLPEEWTDLQCLSLNPCLGFRFDLDDRMQNDFALIDQSAVFGQKVAATRCDSFTMTYRSDTVTESVMRTAHEWKIVPFFIRYEQYNAKRRVEYPRDAADLTKGDVFLFKSAEDFRVAGRTVLTELNELALSLPIDHIDGLPEISREPRMLPISVWTEDVERNKAEGKYGPDGQLKDGLSVVYGTWQTQEIDFSGFEVHIERFYYWDGGFFLALRYHYPEDWTEQMRKSVRLHMEAYADEELLLGPSGRGYGNKTFFYTGQCRTDSLSDRYVICEQTNASLSDPIDAKEITFRIVLQYFPEIEDLNGKRYDLTNGEPFYVDRFMTELREEIPLLTITIPTERLVFQKGE
jgi:hypothetical protein